MDNVRSVFHRQLTIPSAVLAETLKEYQEWEEQQGVPIGDENDELAGAPTHVSSAYKKALQMSTSREPLEDKIAKDPAGSAEQLQHYLASGYGSSFFLHSFLCSTVPVLPSSLDMLIRHRRGPW